ncbi:MAG: SpoIIIAH-like family protein [Lachnospiraceae bacterium]|nr:SpoIIIAH-like family protein [Lachnospiraceae bacterium]
MKNIFKKNQIIITALAIMICVAGYLNFARDKAGEPEAEQMMQQGTQGYFAENGEELYGDISDDDLMANSESALNVSDNGELIMQENGVKAEDQAAATQENPASETSGGIMEEELAEPGEMIDENAAMESDMNAVPEGGTNASAEETAAEAPADSASGEQAAAQTGEEVAAADEQEVSNPGEAVLTSTSLNSSFFSTAKLQREQTRAKQKESLMDIIADTAVSEEQKQAAIDSIIEMTSIAEKENAAETLLEAKGFDGAVVTIIEEDVDVVVNCPSITDQQVAQIEDIVMRKTGAEIDNITITSVIVEE